MVYKKTTIPWASEEVWGQTVLSISKVISVISAHSSLRGEAAGMQALVQQIVQSYAEIEMVLDRICITSCPTCPDVCCSRATVWYDLKDLLVIYLKTDAFPKEQIYRLPDNSCCNLTPSGCRLPRFERPFICTWYICPEQNKVLKEFSGGDEGVDIFLAIDVIKKTRKDLEQAYIEASFGC